MSKISKIRTSQRGAGSSSYVGSFYASTVDGNNAVLSRVTEKNIDKSPMFNPLKADTVIPTGTSGIIPTGLYLAGGPNGLSGKSCKGKGNGKGNGKGKGESEQSGGAFKSLFKGGPDTNAPTFNPIQAGGAFKSLAGPNTPTFNPVGSSESESVRLFYDGTSSRPRRD